MHVLGRKVFNFEHCILGVARGMDGDSLSRIIQWKNKDMNETYNFCTARNFGEIPQMFFDNFKFSTIISCSTHKEIMKLHLLTVHMLRFKIELEYQFIMF